jgi:cysteine desulfurase
VSAVVGILVPVLYLDHAATTPLRPEAAAAMAPYLDGEFGNPSGMHAVSRRAKNAIEEARERVAAVVGAHPLDVVFTGAGTESDNLAVAGVALAGGRRGGVVTTAIEHEAVLATAHHLERLGCPLTIVPVDQYGVVDPERVRDAVAGSTAVVSVMAANNETGAVQPVAAIAEAVAGRGILLHSDAVQAAVSRPCSLDDLGVDLLTLSAHKLGGPQGVGILALRPGIALEPVIHGGGQELGRRSGTHNVAGIVGAAAALEAAVADRKRLVDDVTAARQRFESGLTSVVSGVVFTVGDADRLVQHSHLRIPGIDAETLLVRLDGIGLAASAGSACHSGAIAASHVLTAMGLAPTEASECVRFTFGWDTRPQDGDTAAALVAATVGALR